MERFLKLVKKISIWTHVHRRDSDNTMYRKKMYCTVDQSLYIYIHLVFDISNFKWCRKYCTYTHIKYILLHHKWFRACTSYIADMYNVVLTFQDTLCIIFSPTHISPRDKRNHIRTEYVSCSDDEEHRSTEVRHLHTHQPCNNYYYRRSSYFGAPGHRRRQFYSSAGSSTRFSS